MKILFCSLNAVPGAGSINDLTWQWVSMLALDHTVTLLTDPEYRNRIEARDVARSVQVRYVPFRQPKRLHWYFRFYAHQRVAVQFARRMLHEEQFDVVFTFSPESWRMPTSMWRLDIPSVWGPIGGGESFPFRMLSAIPLKWGVQEIIRGLSQVLSRFDPWVRKSLMGHSLVLVENDTTLRLVRRVAKGRYTVLSNQLVPSVATEDRGHRTGHLRFLFAGTLLHRKGVSLAIKAFAELGESLGSLAHLTVVGDGPMREECQRLVFENSLQKSVTFLGRIPRVRLLSMFKEFDVFVFPSLRDSCGTSLVEAMAAGLPVVCFDNSGPADLVDASCGWLCPIGCGEMDAVGNLAHAIRHIVSSPGEVEARSNGARKRIESKQLLHESKRARINSLLDEIMSTGCLEASST